MVAAPDDKGPRIEAKAAPGVGGRPASPRWMYALLAAFAAVAAAATYRMVDTTGQLTAIERERLSLLQEKGRLDNALASARKQVDELKSVQSAAEAEIKKSREDAKAASTQSVQFQERAKALEAELKGARDELANTSKARGDADAHAANIERDIGAMKTQITDLQQKLSATKSSLQAALDAKAKAEAQVQQLQQQIKTGQPQAPAPQ